MSQKRPRTEQSSASSSQHAVPSPWPRPEGQKIVIARQWEDVPAKVLARSDVMDRPITTEWDDYDSLLYNEWLKMKLAPTRVAHPRTMSGLGIKREVQRLLQTAGLGTVATRTYDLYPDLVCQFFASARLGFSGSDDESRDDMRLWRLSFKIRGVCHQVTLRDFCRLYGFDEDRTYAKLPESPRDTQAFWAKFGTGRYAVASSTHTDVRHPILRYLLRLFSTTILYKLEPGKMRLQELALLSYALRKDVEGTHWDETYDENWMEPHPNMGVVFARHLLSLKNTPVTVKNTNKAFAAGSLLTPLFRFCDIDTSDCTVDSTWCTVDIDYLTRATWLKSDVHWVFRPRPGQQRMVKLPLPEPMDISANPASLAFEPDERLLRAVGAVRKQITRGSGAASTSAASTPSTPHQIPPLPPVPDRPMEQSEFQSWVVQSLQTMWTAISTLPRCGCVRPRPSTPRPSSSSEEED